MRDLLFKYLSSKGIKSPTELDKTPTTDGSPTEFETYKNYEKTLSKDELSIGDIKKFLTMQIGIIEARWKDFSTSAEKKAELIPYHTVYKTLEQAISAPKAEREQLEAHLNKLLQ